MKLKHFLSASLVIIGLLSRIGASVGAAETPGLAPGVSRTIAGAEPPALLKFDLNFTGGTPQELIDAIQTAAKHPVNVIIPQEFAQTRLPALKMRNVDAAQLFAALSAASQNLERPSKAGSPAEFLSASFQVAPGQRLSDDTIWYFYVQRRGNVPNPKICRFYPLARYLESGATVDDVTTAIKTGTRMLGEGEGPEISFHKDTKLLIAVGEPSKLEIIDAVLKALDSQMSSKASGLHPKDDKK
jgi:hypothetical protein